MTTKSKKVKTRRPRKFFVKENGDIAVVTSQYFHGFPRRMDALGVAVQTWHEIQTQLVRDAVSGVDERIGTITITEGLERSMKEFERTYPFLLKEIASIGAKGREI